MVALTLPISALVGPGPASAVDAGFDQPSLGSSVSSIDAADIPRPIIKHHDVWGNGPSPRHSAIFINTNPIFQGFQVDLVAPDYAPNYDTSTQRENSVHNDIHGLKSTTISNLNRTLSLPGTCAGIDPSYQTCIQLEAGFMPGSGENLAWKLTDSDGFSVIGPPIRTYMPNLLDSRPSPPSSVDDSSGLQGIVVDWAEPLNSGSSPLTSYSIDAVLVNSPPPSNRLEVLGVVPSVVSEFESTAVEIHGTGFTETTIVRIGATELSEQSFISPQLIVGKVAPKGHLETDPVSVHEGDEVSTLLNAVRYESLIQAPIPEITPHVDGLEFNVTWESDFAALHDPFYRIDFASSRDGQTVLNGIPWDDPCIYYPYYAGYTVCGGFVSPWVGSNPQTCPSTTNCYGTVSYPQTSVTSRMGSQWAGDVRVFKFATVVTNLRVGQRTISNIVEYEWRSDGTGRVLSVSEPHTFGAAEEFPHFGPKINSLQPKAQLETSDEFHGIVPAGTGLPKNINLSSLKPGGLFAISVAATNRSGTGNPATIYVTVPAKTLSKTPTPKISGTTKVGKKLQARVGKWDKGVKLQYLWKRNGEGIIGASKSSYKLRRADKGTKISLQVTGSKKGFASVGKTSAETAAIR
jgi:hypothetical protein